MRFLLWTLLPSAFAQVQPSSPVWLPPNATSYRSEDGWATLLGDSLWFYAAQRSGKLSTLEKERVPWRNDSALEDGQDVGVDLSGGFYDAGNFIKATLPLTFTLNMLAWSGIAHGAGYDAANQSAYLDNVLRAGFDWLIKCHPDDETLYVLVGSTDPDAAYWGRDFELPTDRPSYAVTASKPGSDVTASVAAAFAAGAYLYSGRSGNIFGERNATSKTLANTTYSATLLEHARSLYDFSLNTTQTLYQDSVPAVKPAYPSSGYLDDQVFAALWLHAATSNSSTSPYLNEAIELYTKAKIAGSNAVLNWDSRGIAASVLLSLFSNTASYSGEVSRYFDNLVGAPRKHQENNAPYYTEGGLLYYSGDSAAASLNPALTAASLVYLLPNSSQSWLDLADSQSAYALGDNPMHMPYVVGVHPSSPKNPHSSLASGGNDIGNINTVPKEEAYVLYGAVVGGPSKYDLFGDVRSNYIQTEATLDYNAPLVVIAAYKTLMADKAPFYSTLNPSSRRDLSGWTTAQIAGCAAGTGVAVILLLIACTYWQRDRIGGRSTMQKLK